MAVDQKWKRQEDVSEDKKISWRQLGKERSQKVSKGENPEGKGAFEMHEYVRQEIDSS